MHALDEIELIDPSEIAEAEAAATRLPVMEIRPTDKDLYRAIAEFRGASYAMLVEQFSSLTSSYLKMQEHIRAFKLMRINSAAVKSIRPSLEDFSGSVNSLAEHFERSSNLFDGESGRLIKQMSSIVQKMQIIANVFLIACDEAPPPGNRAWRRANRKGFGAVAHAPKGPKRKPRPKPNR